MLPNLTNQLVKEPSVKNNQTNRGNANYIIDHNKNSIISCQPHFIFYYKTVNTSRSSSSFFLGQKHFTLLTSRKSVKGLYGELMEHHNSPIIGKY